MRVSAPGSSANLGAGFDALALAVAMRLVVDDDPGVPDAVLADEHHPAVLAHRAAGGDGRLVVHGGIPAARGLGFSGAARVAGAFAARSAAGDDEATARRCAYQVAAELEGHADNAAASSFGGVVVAAGSHVLRVPLGVLPGLVVWIPSYTTSTRAARADLPAAVALADAAFNVGRAALLVAALAAGDVTALREATEDRLHQERRLAAVPASRAALERCLELGAWGAWLSGSGPTVAAFVAPAEAERIAASLPAGGEARVVALDTAGVRVEG